MHCPVSHHYRMCIDKLSIFAKSMLHRSENRSNMKCVLASIKNGSQQYDFGPILYRFSTDFSTISSEIDEKSINNCPSGNSEPFPYLFLIDLKNPFFVLSLSRTTRKIIEKKLIKYRYTHHVRAYVVVSSATPPFSSLHGRCTSKLMRSN